VQFGAFDIENSEWYCVLAHKAKSEHNDEQHLELLLTVHRVRMARGHDDALTLVQDVLDAVDRDPAHAVEAGDHRVAAGFVGADLLTLVKREERDAHVLVLRQRAADDLTGLIGDLIAQGQNLCFAGVRSGAVQDAARRCVLIFLFTEKVRKQSVFAPFSRLYRKVAHYRAACFFAWPE